ncbi:MAG TPA: glycosyltransferase [Nitrososphaeraceae archaeon]|nr:glycosyltransferase [Nitrososphaeraceae archaeon]
MKAVVIHHTLNSAGGESSFAIETIYSLSKLGYDVELVTVQKPDLKLITKTYGKELPVKKIRSIIPFKMNVFGIYQRLLTVLSSLNLNHSDIIIDTNGTNLPLNISQNILYIAYIHFPAILQTSDGYNNNKYNKSLFWKSYFKPYQVMAHLLTKQALKRADIVLTNSLFTKKAIQKVFPSINPQIIYPPIDIQNFSNCYNSNSRKQQVLVISRFSPEKQIEKAILIAKLLPNIPFKIIGSLLPVNQSYYNYIQQMIQNYGLMDRIQLIPNATKNEMINALSSSLIYLHTMYGEHFGISIVEAMASGLIPIVPSYGGCSEIVPLEYQYNTIPDAAACIFNSIYHYDTTKKNFLYGIAKQFSPENFTRNLKSVIDQTYIENKHRYSPLQ